MQDETTFKSQYLTFTIGGALANPIEVTPQFSSHFGERNCYLVSCYKNDNKLVPFTTKVYY